MVLSPMLKKLLFVRQFAIEDGKISLLGGREVMLDASALLELQEIDETKLYDIAKKSSFRNLVEFVSHARVYYRVKDAFMQNIYKLGGKIGQNDAGIIKTLQDIFNIYGLGEMSIQNIDNAKKEVLIAIKDSTVAEEWLKKYKARSKIPVCTLTAGILAGMFSYVFNKETDCVELKCKAAGNSYCLFKVG